MTTPWRRRLWWAAALLLYFLLTTYQLGLPGLHYDEAREAGLNALELLTGAPVTAFRNATVPLSGRQLPLMVQDYIGALNVYLALPFLAITGIGVPNLRLLPILTGAATLLTVERAVSAWMVWRPAPLVQETDAHEDVSPVSLSSAGLIAMTLLAASPSFIFWSRQGIFVTNITQPLCFVCIWQGIRWLQGGRPRALILSAFSGGLALYAKLLAIWIVGPFALLAGGWWLWHRRQGALTAPLSPWTFTVAVCAFLLPLTPLVLFNWQTGGTFVSLFANLRESYYGVDNRAVLRNLPVRIDQLVQSLRGDHLWYLGGLYGNALAPWAGGLVVLSGAWMRPRRVLPPALLLLCALGLSLFTISDLFVTHFALLQPLAIAVIAIGFGGLLAALLDASRAHPVAGWTWPSFAALLTASVIVAWVAFDLAATARYHGALTRSGGLSDHSDATYHLAYHLRYNGMGAPLALDWGLDAPVRFLSRGAVRPIEIFGYASPAAPDAAFDARLAPFLDNPDTVYLLRAPQQTVFAGRRAAFMAAAAARGYTPELAATFSQRDGAPLFELWRVHHSNSDAP